jgi:type I restriction enzyme R subunit
LTADSEIDSKSDVALKQAAAVNPGDKFELVFKNLLEARFVKRMD